MAEKFEKEKHRDTRRQLNLQEITFLVEPIHVRAMQQLIFDKTRKRKIEKYLLLKQEAVILLYVVSWFY